MLQLFLSENISKNLHQEDKMTDSVKTPWKNGLYASDANRGTYLKVNGQKVDMFSTAILDFPDSDPMGDGTWTFGDFEPAHEEVQTAAGGVKNSNVEMNLFNGKKIQNFYIQKTF